MSLKDALSPVLKEYESGGGGGGGLEDYDRNVDTLRLNAASTDPSAFATKGNRYTAVKDILLSHVVVALGLTSFTDYVYECFVYVHGTGTDLITAKYKADYQAVVNYSLLTHAFPFNSLVDLPAGTVFDVVIVNKNSPTTAAGITEAAANPPSGSLASGAITYVGGIKKAVAELNVGDSIESATNRCVLQTIFTLSPKE